MFSCVLWHSCCYSLWLCLKTNTTVSFQVWYAVDPACREKTYWWNKLASKNKHIDHMEPCSLTHTATYGNFCSAGIALCSRKCFGPAWNNWKRIAKPAWDKSRGETALKATSQTKESMLQFISFPLPVNDFGGGLRINNNNKVWLRDLSTYLLVHLLRIQITCFRGGSKTAFLPFFAAFQLYYMKWYCTPAGRLNYCLKQHFRLVIMLNSGVIAFPTRCTNTESHNTK